MCIPGLRAQRPGVPDVAWCVDSGRGVFAGRASGPGASGVTVTCRPRRDAEQIPGPALSPAGQELVRSRPLPFVPRACPSRSAPPLCGPNQCAQRRPQTHNWGNRGTEKRSGLAQAHIRTWWAPAPCRNRPEPVSPCEGPPGRARPRPPQQCRLSSWGLKTKPVCSRLCF